mmetsp:Transcript_13967/g.21139  ORF Transcript_13967/g.21139 Transcript_13967/m.21139 type:complete len:248 (+) Transcript_13967:7-750(+)
MDMDIEEVEMDMDVNTEMDIVESSNVDEKTFEVATLYVNRIPEKIKLPELKDQLLNYFIKLGYEPIKITAHDSLKRKGQAWVVFRQPSLMQKAYEASKQSKPPFQNACIYISNTPSDPSVPPEVQRQRAIERKRKRDAAKQHVPQPQPKRQTQQRRTNQPKPKRQNLPPNSKLFVESIPSSITEKQLVDLFSKPAGMVQLRYVPQKNCAFVEYDNIAKATIAKDTLHGFPIVSNQMISISYAAQAKS